MFFFRVRVVSITFLFKVVKTYQMAEEARVARKKRVQEEQSLPLESDKDLSQPRNLAGTGLRIGANPDPESIRVEGQEYLVVSFVSPRSRQKSQVPQSKFRGVFATEQAANDHARLVHDTDPDFDVHIVRMWHWIPTPPPEDVCDKVRMEYANQETLNNIMKGHYDSIERDRLRVEKRKTEAQEAARKKRQ